MKDGTTHLAYKAEHVVDLDTEMVLAAEIYAADRGRHRHAGRQPDQAQINLIAAESAAKIEEAVADKGYHAAETLATVNETLGVRTYIPEPKRKALGSGATSRRRERRAMTANRRRMRASGARGCRRRRSELTERTSPTCVRPAERGRCWLHGMLKVSKRYCYRWRPATWG